METTICDLATIIGHALAWEQRLRKGVGAPILGRMILSEIGERGGNKRRRRVETEACELLAPVWLV
jgi:hypothetical protein